MKLVDSFPASDTPRKFVKAFTTALQVQHCVLHFVTMTHSYSATTIASPNTEDKGLPPFSLVSHKVFNNFAALYFTYRPLSPSVTTDDRHNTEF